MPTPVSTTSWDPAEPTVPRQDPRRGPLRLPTVAWRPRLPTWRAGGRDAGVRAACGMAAVCVALTGWVNLTAGLAAAVVVLAVAVVLLARSRDRLRARVEAHERARHRPPPALGYSGPEESTVAYLRSPPRDGPTTVRERLLDWMPWSSHPDGPAMLPAAGAHDEDAPMSEPVPVAVGIAVPGRPETTYVVVSDVLVGRGREAELVIDDPTISRRHALLTWQDDGWFVRPASDAARIARNGRWLHGVDQTPLKDGDKLALGVRGTELTWGVVPPEVPAPDPTSDLVLLVGANTTPGRRPRNEDAYYVGPTLVAVADGAGGELAGAIASTIAVDTLQTPEAARRSLEELVAAANSSVLAGQGHPSRAGMASTLDVVRLTRSGETTMLEIAHLGDGTVFLQTPTGAAQRLTTPHRSVSEDGQRSWLDRSLGTDVEVEAQYGQLHAEEGQRIVLATDGLLDHFGERRLGELLRQLRDASPRRVADMLVHTAVREDAADNVTVVVADVHPHSLREHLPEGAQS